MNGRYHTNIINNKAKSLTTSMALSGPDNTNLVQTGDNSHIYIQLLTSSVIDQTSFKHLGQHCSFPINKRDGWLIFM